MNKQQKEQYLREYALLKAQGKPFFPYAVAKDSVMFVVVMTLSFVPAGPSFAMREFKDSITGKDKDDDDEDRDAFGESTDRPKQAAIDPSAAEPEVVTGEARREDQPASRADS